MKNSFYDTPTPTKSYRDAIVNTNAAQAEFDAAAAAFKAASDKLTAAHNAEFGARRALEKSIADSAVCDYTMTRFGY